MMINLIHNLFIVCLIQQGVATSEYFVPIRRHGLKNHIEAALQRAKNREPLRLAIELHDFESSYHALSNVTLPLSPYDSRRASLNRYHSTPSSSSPSSSASSTSSTTLPLKTRGDYGKNTPTSVKSNQSDRMQSHSKERTLSVSDTSFVSCSDIIYFGEVSLGTPLQTLQVILDTGSADLWVFSSTCTNCPAGTDKYSHAQSSSYVADGTEFSIQYADGDHVSGVLSKDKMTWGGLVAPSQEFAEISDAASFSITCVEDGLLGMAFDSIASSGKTTPFHSLMLAGQVTSNIFAFYLSDDDSGVLTLGGTNNQHHSTNIIWFTLSTPRYGFWEIDLHYAQPVGGSKVAVGHTAIMDTGTTLLIGPPEAVISIAKDVGAKCYFLKYLPTPHLELRDCDSGGSFYMALISCGTGLESQGGNFPDPPEVSFMFGTTNNAAHSFSLSADDYSLAPSPCPGGYTMDCGGSCISSHDEVWSWLGDGTCDAGQYGYWFNCPALGCDGGDCSSEECYMGDPGEECYFGIDGGLNSGDTYWIFGDVFLRKVYTAYNYGDKKVGLAYSAGTTIPIPQPTPHPMPQPTSHPIPQPTPHPIPQPTPHPIPQPTSHPIPQPTSHPIPQPTPHPIPQPTPYPMPQPTPHPVVDSTPRPSSSPSSNAPTLFPSYSSRPQPSTPYPSPTLLSPSPILLITTLPSVSPTNVPPTIEEWSWIDITLSINADESPDNYTLMHIINALFEVSTSLGDTSNVQEYSLLEWSSEKETMVSSKQQSVWNQKRLQQAEKSTADSFHKEKMLSLSARHSIGNQQSLQTIPSSVIGLRGQQHQESVTQQQQQQRKRFLSSGVASIQVRVSADSSTKSGFTLCEEWRDQVSLELTLAINDGTFDNALREECNTCGLTAGSQSVEMTSPRTTTLSPTLLPTLSPTLSPTKESRRRRGDDDSKDDGGGDRRHKSSDDDGSSDSSAAAAGAAIAVIVVVLILAAVYMFCHHKDSSLMTWCTSERLKFNAIFQNFDDHDDVGEEVGDRASSAVSDNGVELSRLDARSGASPPPRLSQQSISDSIYEAHSGAYGFEAKSNKQNEKQDKGVTIGNNNIDSSGKQQSIDSSNDATEGKAASSYSDLIYSAQLSHWSMRRKKKDLTSSNEAVESIESNPLHSGSYENAAADDDNDDNQFYEANDDQVRSDEESMGSNQTASVGTSHMFSGREKKKSSSYQSVQGNSSSIQKKARESQYTISTGDGSDEEEFEEVPLSFKRTAML